MIEESKRLLPQFAKRGGSLPVVVQDARSGEVLMLAYTDRAALDRTIQTGDAWFRSTSRNAMWRKGETSGNTLTVHEIRIDCDQDALLYRVTVAGGGVCHTNNAVGSARRRCFYRSLSADGTLLNEEPPASAE